MTCRQQAKRIPATFLQWLLLVVLLTLAAQRASFGQEPADTNYDEAKVPKYTLPDPLICFDGRKVSDAAMWRDKVGMELSNKEKVEADRLLISTPWRSPGSS